MINMPELFTEAKQYGISNLHRDTGISRSHIYGIFEGRIDPKLSTYNKILNALGYKLTVKKESKAKFEINEYLQNRDYLIWNLAYHGAPLLVEKKFSTTANINQTLTAALSVGRENSDINAILPYFIYSNWDKINWNKVRENTLEKLYLAYLINLISNITNDLKCSKELMTLEKMVKPKKMQLLIKSKISPFERKMLRHVDNRIAKTWKFLTADQLSGIEARFNKWALS